MNSLFKRNDTPSLGVEVELQLVDSETMELKSAITEIREAMPEEMQNFVKPELMQCYLEVNTGICRDVTQVHADLAEKIRLVEEVAAKTGTRLYWSGAHPFSPWYDQKISPDERYQGLVELLQDTARRVVVFGLHVHVGVESGDKAIMICDRILRYLPVLLALSANSPFWNGRKTGLHSQRSKIMETLPTAGMPPLMRNWSEYIWLLRHLIETGFIKSIREIWWDVRPHKDFGTVEVRVCDVPGDMEDVLGLTALIQCLVRHLSSLIDKGAYQHDMHPMMALQNKWRACRYGLEASLVDPETHQPVPARDLVKDLVERLRDTATSLGCAPQLQHVYEMACSPTGSQRQLEVYEKSGDFREVVREGLTRSSLLG